MNTGSFAAIGNGGKKYTLTFEYVCDTFFLCTDIIYGGTDIFIYITGQEISTSFNKHLSRYNICICD